MIKDRLYGVGILLSTLFLYSLTSFPTVAYIDSGELAVVNWTLGIAHPTGYPLYTLLGRLFALLPLELIKTQNLFGALATSASAVTFYFLIKRTLIAESRWNKITAATLALLFGVTPLIWSQGTTNEVYSLHILFVALVLLCISQSTSSGITPRIFLLGGFLFGLSFGNHLSTVLLAPVVVIYLWHHRRALSKRPRLLGTGVVLFILGVSIYLYLPIRSSLEPLFNWGAPHTWENFIRHVSGWQYQVWMFNQDGSELLKQAGRFATILYHQFPLPLWPAIVWGIYAGFKRLPRMQLYMAVLLLTNLIYSLNFSIADIDNYLLPSVLSLLYFGAVGLVDLVDSLKLRLPVVAAIAAVLIIWNVAVNWQAQDNSENYAAMDGVHNYYKSVTPPALIFCANWDFVSPWLYSHYYLKEEPQVLIVDNELLRRTWYFGWLKQAEPKLYEFIRPEYEAFLPHLKLFEAEANYNPVVIENHFQALLRKFTQYEARRFYFDQSAQLRFQVNGQIMPSGQLFRLLREGDSLQLPDPEIAPPRFGKPESALSGREKWHIKLFNSMQPRDGVE